MVRTILTASKRPGWVNPLIRRTRRAFLTVDRMQRLHYFCDAPEDVQLRIRRAGELLFEALSDYEAYWESYLAELKADSLAGTGDYTDSDAIERSRVRGIGRARRGGGGG